ITNESFNETIEEISNETVNETTPEQENITENLTINKTINETVEGINQTLNQTINETINESINETINETTDSGREEFDNDSIEINETIEEISLEKETEEEKIIEELTTEQIDLGDISDEINSLFISNNNTLIVEIYNELIETLNNHNLTDSNKRYFIETRFIANGFSYNISKTIKDNFTDEFVLEIENPYHHDFTNLSLIVNLTTEKREIGCRNPLEILERNNSISKIQINEINLPRRDSIRIEIIASSPTFDYEVDNLDAMAKILITRREGDKFFIDYMLKDSNTSLNLSSDIVASCGASDNKIEWLNDKQDNRLTFDASDCNSTILIEVSKKNITGVWIEHKGYREYIDLSDRIIINPEEIFLRGNCVECLSKNVCDPLTICPQSNSGLYGWDFVADMIFNISTFETNDKGIEKAELCLFNTYASTNQEINAYITSEENSSCQPLYENIRTDFDSGYATIKKQSQKDVVFRPEWICTDVKEILEHGINNSNEKVVFRIIGQDMNNSNQPFMCFDAGMLSEDECEGASPEGCLPYLSISYANE
ncbi:MAG: hypothetical protein PWQ87_812, partial [Candidatus Woesearchaeota archaeon]|nr:hypothetical protein [Candidatus Woesearchaeota archaeon]